MIDRIPPQVRTLEERMTEAVAHARESGGRLVRYPGGFWARQGLKTWAKPWFGPSAIEALVANGTMAYSEWETSGNYDRPVEVVLLEKSDA
jgi:hypothetical protein